MLSEMLRHRCHFLQSAVKISSKPHYLCWQFCCCTESLSKQHITSSSAGWPGNNANTATFILCSLLLLASLSIKTFQRIISSQFSSTYTNRICKNNFTGLWLLCLSQPDSHSRSVLGEYVVALPFSWNTTARDRDIPLLLKIL